jgi:GNAT superfamily N-acetyltransferase
MALNNFERMILLAEEVFATKNDPEQLDVNQEVIERLKRMHPLTVMEYDEGNGPIAWVLVIPSTLELMKRFLDREITERELFDLTPEDSVYDALYLCSALVLYEYRRKGITKKLSVNAIEQICRDHPLKALFIWAFSKEGELAAETIARLTSMPFYKRKD